MAHKSCPERTRLRLAAPFSPGARQSPVALLRLRAAIGERLRELGPGSSAVVGFDREDAPGHWFNVVNHEGKLLAVDGQAARFEEWPPSRDGLGFDESGMSYSDAIYFTADGKVREMITSDEAERIATEVIGPATAGDGQGWHLEEFDSGWFIREDWMSEKSIRGGSFCVVERATGRVLAFPSSISPARIMTEYAQVVDRFSSIRLTQ